MRRAVLARIGGRSIAIPVEHVVETMRPLPIIPLPAEDNISDYEIGYSRIRGEDCRVFDGSRLFAAAAVPATRFLIIRDGERRVALQVDAVLGVQALADGTPVGPVPALAAALQDARWLAPREDVP